MSSVKTYKAAIMFFLTLSQINLASSSSLPDFTKLIENESTSIVQICAKRKIPKQFLDESTQEIPPFLRDFFQDSIPETPNNDGNKKFVSLGSGFIISSDGYILTNNHVVSGYTDIIVRFSDSDEVKAQLIGKDLDSDIALLKVNKKNLASVELGDSRKLKPGQWVAAIGAPFGINYTVTKGIISAINSDIGYGDIPFIQTDVALYPGNSGGPLFNLDGEVIGINSEVIIRPGGFAPASLSIPINMATNIARQLKDSGKVHRGWLGIVIQDIGINLASSFGLESPKGTLVVNLIKDGPGDKGGIQIGDLIVGINGYPITRANDLTSYLHYLGGIVENRWMVIKVIREGKCKYLNIDTVIENSLGLQVSDLTSKQKELNNTEFGVFIQHIEEELAVPALRPGDIISHLNNKKVTNTTSFLKIVKDLSKNDFISLRFLRHGLARYTAFKLKN